MTYLEECLMNYFEAFRVGVRDEDGVVSVGLPKKNTLESAKSGLKNWILTRTKNQVDIMNKGMFPRFTMLIKGLFRELKQEGKGDTTHHEPIDEASLAKIYAAIKNVTELFKCRGTDAYLQHLEKVPASYRSLPHKWLQMCIQFTISLLDVRRGCEGLRELKKNHFVKHYDEETRMYYFRKEKSEATKNNKDVDEDLGVSGIIPFRTGQDDFNPGETLELYLGMLNPASDALFQRFRRLSKDFKIEDKNTDIYFEKEPVGINEIKSMMKKLCDQLGLKPFTNHCIRSTAIVMFKKMGFEDRLIMKLSGHRCATSLMHYDPAATVQNRADMAAALLMQKKRKTEDKENEPVQKSPKVEDESFHGFSTQDQRGAVSSVTGHEAASIRLPTSSVTPGSVSEPNDRQMINKLTDSLIETNKYLLELLKKKN